MCRITAEGLHSLDLPVVVSRITSAVSRCDEQVVAKHPVVPAEKNKAEVGHLRLAAAYAKAVYAERYNLVITNSR